MKMIKILMVGLILCALLAPLESNAQATSTMEEVAWSAYIPCANDGYGEVAYGTLKLHVVIGKNLVQFQAAGGELIGEITGDVYRPTGKTSYVQTSFENGTPVYTFVNIYHMVGPGVQYMVKEVFHYIFKDGMWQLIVENSEVTCK
ncbi:MAG: hypothetical protein ACOZDD_13140 [Bacteroidota bacterium]